MGTLSVPMRVVQATGATSRQLDYWVRRGFLPLAAPGSGYRRDWNDDVVVRARKIRQLADLGFTIETCVRLVDVEDDEVSMILTSDADGPSVTVTFPTKLTTQQ